MASLTLQQKIGQLLMVGFEGETLTEPLFTLIKQYKIGNVVLFARNCRSREQLGALCRALHDQILEHTGLPPLLSIDEEGGTVSRLPEDSVLMPGARAIADLGELDLVSKAAAVVGEELRALGINCNLAPVLDVQSNLENPVIGMRSFSTQPEQVAAAGVAALRGYQQAGILCVGKHFPGHGDTSVDSHLALPVIDKTLAELEQQELISFGRAIEAGIPGIMLAHLLFPRMEREKKPVTMSAWMIQDLLRKQLQFEGIVFSDCLEMDAIRQHFGTVAGGIAALRAGVDVACISHTTSYAGEISEQLCREVEKGVFPLERVEESVERIARYKQTLQPPATLLPRRAEAGVALAATLQSRSIRFVNRQADYRPQLGEHPLFLSPPPHRATQAANGENGQWGCAAYLADRLGGVAHFYAVQPDEEEIQQILQMVATSSPSSVVIATYHGRKNFMQLRLVEQLIQSLRENAAGDSENGSRLRLPLVLIALQGPDDFGCVGDQVDQLVAYADTQPSLSAIADRLCQTAISS